MTDKTKFMKTSWDYRLVMEAYDTIASLSSLERETVAPGAVRSIFRFKNNSRMAGKRKMVKVNIFFDLNWKSKVRFSQLSFDFLNFTVKNFALNNLEEFFVPICRKDSLCSEKSSSHAMSEKGKPVLAIVVRKKTFCQFSLKLIAVTRLFCNTNAEHGM